MEGGYWDNTDKIVLFCTECLTKAECLALIRTLSNLGIKAGLKRRNKVTDSYPIRVSRMSVPLLRTLVKDHINPVFAYKIGNV